MDDDRQSLAGSVATGKSKKGRFSMGGRSREVSNSSD